MKLKERFYKMRYKISVMYITINKEKRELALQNLGLMLLEEACEKDITVFILPEIITEDGISCSGRFTSTSNEEMNIVSKNLRESISAYGDYSDNDKMWYDHREMILPRIEISGCEDSPLHLQTDTITTLSHELGHAKAKELGLKMGYEEEEEFADHYLIEKVKELPNLIDKIALQIPVGAHTNRKSLYDLDNYFMLMGITWEDVHKYVKNKKKSK